MPAKLECIDCGGHTTNRDLVDEAGRCFVCAAYHAQGRPPVRQLNPVDKTYLAHPPSYYGYQRDKIRL